MDKKYKFKDLLVYSSTETMNNNTKRYRSVFENRETTYLYAELSLFNKLFDEEDWKTKVVLKAFRTSDGERKELCKIEKEIEVKKDLNIVMVREGWGNSSPGVFWTKGQYE